MAKGSQKVSCGSPVRHPAPCRSKLLPKIKKIQKENKQKKNNPLDSSPSLPAGAFHCTSLNSSIQQERLVWGLKQCTSQGRAQGKAECIEAGLGAGKGSVKANSTQQFTGAAPD